METLSPSLRELARRLIAASRTTSDPRVHETVLVIEKLRISLARFAGADGFTSLLRRALALAGEEVPSLKNVKVGTDGRLEGLGKLADRKGAGAPENAGGGSAGAEAAVAITAHLLGLLVTFIGRPFTMRLVREAWPNEALDDSHSRTEAD